MGLRGTAKVPTEILEARGSWRAKLAQPSSDIPRDNIVAPDWLSESAREHWSDIVQLLKPSGVLANSDCPMLAMLVNAMTVYFNIHKQYEEGGCKATIVTVNHRGDEVVRPNPLLKSMWEAYSQVIKTMQQFGMSPSSRSSMNIAPPKDEVDPREKLLKIG